MATLDAALKRAMDGHGGIVMVVGGPGAGKTRMALEFARRAGDAGAFAAIGRCFEGDGLPAHYPWMMCVRGYVEKWGAAALAKTAGVHAIHLARFLPEAGLPARAARVAPGGDTANLPYRLFDAMTAFLKRLCAERSSVIVLDNLHLADPSSLAFLEFLAPELSAMQLLIVGTYRDTDVRRGHPLSAVLGALAKEQAFERIHLGGFSVPEVAALAREALGRDLPRELIGTIHERTEGNPLFVTEVMRLQEERLRSSGDVAADFPLPEGIREAIGRRLDRLPAEAVGVLGTAAVIGRTFDLALLCRLTADRGESPILEALEAAADARIVEEAGAGRWRFSHAMIRETLLDELSASRRVRLHADIAGALETVPESEPGHSAADLFRHHREASVLLGTAGMVRAAIRTAGEALRAEANENALACLDAAIEAKRQHDGDGEMDREMAELCAWRSSALYLLLRLEESRAELRRAFGFFTRSGDRHRALELLFCHNTGPYKLPVCCPDLVQQAFGMVEPGSLDEARLRWGYAFSLSETWEEARATLDRARETARAHGDRALEARIAAETLFVVTCTGSGEALELESRRASEQADGSAGSVDAFRIPDARFRLHFLKGRTDEAVGALTELCEKIEGCPDAAGHADQPYHRRGVLHLHRGEFAKVREICGEGIARGFRNIGLDGMLALVDMHEGRLDRTSAGWTTALKLVAPNAAFFVMMEALQSGGREHVAEVERKMNETLVSPYWPRLSSHEPRMVLALIACIGDDAHAAAGLYPHILPYAGTMNPGMMHAMPVDRILGLLSVCTGDLDRAVKHFEAAGAFCDRAGFRVERAWVCHDHAMALLPRNRSGDRDAAVALLERGLALSEDIGMRPLADRIASRLKEVRAAGGRSYPDGLTRREVDVLQLVARGMTNQEIGDRLFISHHTAATHVQHILEKTGMANRAELTAYAMRQGLAE